MVKMDHQNGPQIEIAKLKYSAFKSTPFETLNEPNMKIYIIVFTLPFFGWLPNKSTQCSQIFAKMLPKCSNVTHFGSHLTFLTYFVAKITIST